MTISELMRKLLSVLVEHGNIEVQIDYKPIGRETEINYITEVGPRGSGYIRDVSKLQLFSEDDR